jgi:hypothetical protein
MQSTHRRHHGSAAPPVSARTATRLHRVADGLRALPSCSRSTQGSHPERPELRARPSTPQGMESTHGITWSHHEGRITPPSASIGLGSPTLARRSDRADHKHGNTLHLRPDSASCQTDRWEQVTSVALVPRPICGIRHVPGSPTWFHAGAMDRAGSAHRTAGRTSDSTGGRSVMVHCPPPASPQWRPRRGCSNFSIHRPGDNTSPSHQDARSDLVPSLH